MPLDDLQKALLKVLLPRRSPNSIFAGGSVLQRHAYRLSDDQNIFHPSDADIIKIAHEDMEALRRHGYTAEVSKQHEGFLEATVGTERHGFTKIQWVQAGSWTFFKPVPDPEYGWRLHMADLAVNKALAAGGRKQVRDYIDLTLIHRHIIPLWHAIWAAPGKDPSWSPGSLTEKIAMTNAFRQEDIDDEILSTMPLSAGEIGATIRNALEEAREIFERLPDTTAGQLFIDADGRSTMCNPSWPTKRTRCRPNGMAHGLQGRTSTTCLFNASWTSLDGRAAGFSARRPTSQVHKATRQRCSLPLGADEPGARCL